MNPPRERAAHGVAIVSTLLPRRIVLGIAVAATLVSPRVLAGEDGAAVVPDIRIEAPESLAAQQRRLERVDRGRLVAVARLVGLEQPGPTIRVVLVAENSPVARETPATVAAFASGDLVVVFPGRTPSYPHETFEEVLQHEVAHVLIGRAAGHRRVPRWFHEGVARQAERTWSIGERTRFVYALAAGGAVSPSRLDALFRGDDSDVARAYTVSSALLEHLTNAYGPGLPARVLRAMRAGREFEPAFVEATGVTADEAVARFWQGQRLWLTWFPWLTSAQAVYTLITLLAIAAIWRVRARRAARDREASMDDAEGGVGEDGRD